MIRRLIRDRLLPVVVLTLPSSLLFAQHPVIRTEGAYTLGKNNYAVGASFEYFHKSTAQPIPAPQSLYRVLSFSVHSGVADNVDMDLDWRGGLVGVRSDGARSFDWGDLLVSTKVHLFREHSLIPAVALRTSVKLPNTTYQPNRLGSNEMDYFSYLLFAKHWAETEVRLNLGFGIVGDPRAAGNQDDIYSASAAFLARVADHVRVFGEIVGITGFQDNDDKIVVRGGILSSQLGAIWSIYGSTRVFGNSLDFATAFELSESWGIGMNLRKEFSFDPFGFMGGKKDDE